MRKMPAGKFKAQCLAVIDEVSTKHEIVVITKRGRPMAKLVPIIKEDDDIFDFMKGKIQITADIVEPVIPLEEYESLR